MIETMNKILKFKESIKEVNPILISGFANFYGAEFRYNRMERGVYTHSNFHKAKFVQNDMSSVSLTNACVAEADWIDNDTHSTVMTNASESFEDWDAPDDVPGMQM